MKDLKGSFKQALSELNHHKLRTALTLLGMIFGVGAVIAMLSVGEGARREALQLIDSMGVRNVLVQARELDEATLRENRESSLGLTVADMKAAAQTVFGVEATAAEKNIRVYDLFSDYGDSDAAVQAVTPSFFTLSNFHAEQGTLFGQEDNLRFAQLAVLGEQAAEQLFPEVDPVGKRIKINHIWVQVVGVLQSKHLGKDEFQGVSLGNSRNTIYIPLQTAFKRLKFQPLEDEIDSFRLKMGEGTDPNTTAVALQHLMEHRHRDINDFELVVPAALLRQQQQTQQIFTIVMSCVAGISLLVGGIGIMNIMLATVMERTKEIGLLRAVGATRRDVQRQFLIESFTVSAMGALLGIVFGVILALVIQQFAGWAVAWSFSAVFLSVIICVVIGVGFGWYPARRASELDPIRALYAE